MKTLLVPTLGFDLSLLTRLANSIDFPIERKVIVNNGSKHCLDEWKKVYPGWESVWHHDNIGVAGSWNMADFFLTDEDPVLIVNDDVAFNPGALNLIEASSKNRDVPIMFMDEGDGLNCFVWTKMGRDQLGRFDENFWPAYYEDADMKLRLKLSGLKYIRIFNGGAYKPIIHSKPAIGNRFNELVTGCNLLNREYMFRKWGMTEFSLNAGFKKPFDREEFLGAWSFERENRQKRLALWEAFLSMPNPSVYT